MFLKPENKSVTFKLMETKCLVNLFFSVKMSRSKEYSFRILPIFRDFLKLFALIKAILLPSVGDWAHRLGVDSKKLGIIRFGEESNKS